MSNKESIFYNKTANKSARALTVKFLNMCIAPSNAVDIGCGTGNDTVELIKRGWNVLAIDKNNTKDMIYSRLDASNISRFSFKIEEFEKIKIPSNNLVVSNFALSFCKNTEFRTLWFKITTSINLDGFFVGNIFGNNDEWGKTRKEMTFLSKEECLQIFEKNFEILFFEEIEKDGQTAVVENKHWHYFNIIAKKVRN